MCGKFVYESLFLVVEFFVNGCLVVVVCWMFCLFFFWLVFGSEFFFVYCLFFWVFKFVLLVLGKVCMVDLEWWFSLGWVVVFVLLILWEWFVGLIKIVICVLFWVFVCCFGLVCNLFWLVILILMIVVELYCWIFFCEFCESFLWNLWCGI